MGRNYQVTFENVTVIAAQDLVQITGAAGKMMRIKRAWVGIASGTLPAAQGLRLRARFLPATVTVGSAGTTGITPSKKDPGDAACASTTCAINNTVQATSSGTPVVVYANGVHLYQGDNVRFDDPPMVGPSQAFVWELLNTVTGTVQLSGGVELEEVG